MVQKLLPQPAPHKLSNTLLFTVAASGDKRLPQNGQFGLETEEFGCQKPKRRSRHGDRAPIAHDIASLRLRIRIQTTLFQTGVSYQLGDLGRGFKDRIGPKLSQI